MDKKHKLLFCPIAKVANTDIKQLFIRMRGRYTWDSKDGDTINRGLLRLKIRIPLSEAEQLYRDPTWTKAVFIRDPLERLVSGYLDKCRLPLSERYDTACPLNSSLSFQEFVRMVFAMNATGANLHFAPQHLYCDLKVWAPFYQFQGNFSHLRNHTTFLLQSLGLFEDYGRGWYSNSALSGGMDMFEENLNFHKDNSAAGNNVQAKARKYGRLFTKELADEALHWYKTDYDVFSLPVPTWYSVLFRSPAPLGFH